MSNVVAMPRFRSKTGISFEQIFKQLTDVERQKVDFYVNPKTIRMEEDGKLVADERKYDLTGWALNQLCARLGVPYSYLKRCSSNLQSQNINHWISEMEEDGSTRWFLRSLERGNEPILRGILTDKYSEYDNIEILELMTKVLQGTDGEIVMWAPDEASGGFHLRIAFPNLTTQAGVLRDGTPDILKVGLHLANSEVGKRSIVVAPLVYRLVCSNGLMRWDVQGEVFRQRHIHLDRDEIRERVAKAVVVSLNLGDELIKEYVRAKKKPIVDPMKAIEDLAGHNNTFYFSKKMIEQIKTNYTLEKSEGTDTVYDLVNALTRTARDLEDSDRRVTLERFAHKILLA